MCLAMALRCCVQSLTRHDVDAEDLVHDALVRAYEKRPTFHTGGNLKVWLLSILHNVYVDGRRARYAEARHLAGDRKSSAPLYISSRLRASPTPRRLPCSAFRSMP